MTTTIIDLQDKAIATLLRANRIGDKKSKGVRHAAQARFDNGMVALGFDRADPTVSKAWFDACETADLQYVIERDEARRTAKAMKLAA